MWQIQIACAGVLLGASIGALCASVLIDRRDREIKMLRRAIMEKEKRYRQERSARLLKQYDLSNAHDIIGYQRDELYKVKHPAQLKEYEG